MIPVHLKTKESAEPDVSLYYLVTASGTFLVKKTGLFTSITEAPVVPCLLEQKPALTLSFPKLPRELMEKSYGFLQAVYEEWRGEAVVFVYYEPARGGFELGVPPQTLNRFRTSSGAWRTRKAVKYGYTARPPGFIKLGDAHSHAELPAFFSCTDDQDDSEDGLKITLGRLDRRPCDLEVSFVTNGTRFFLKPEDVLENFHVPIPPPVDWLEKVSCHYQDYWIRMDGEETDSCKKTEEQA